VRQHKVMSNPSLGAKDCYVRLIFIEIEQRPVAQDNENMIIVAGEPAAEERARQQSSKLATPFSIPRVLAPTLAQALFPKHFHCCASQR
jgi:hypothetical protein